MRKKTKCRTEKTQKDEHKSVAEETFDCKICGSKHANKNCPAFNQKCNKCDKKGHFAKCCRTKKANATKKGTKVHTVDNQSSDSDSSKAEDLLVYQVNSIRSDNSMWSAEILCNGNKLQVQLDTGAQCNVLPWNIVKKWNAKIKKSSMHRLVSFSGQKINVIGKAKIQVKIKNKIMTLPFQIVDDECSPILGAALCQEMSLIERICKVDIEDDMFRGIGLIKNYEYEIDLIQNPQFEIHAARKIRMRFVNK